MSGIDNYDFMVDRLQRRERGGGNVCVCSVCVC